MSEWKPGDRVLWGYGDPVEGVLAALVRDEDTGEVEVCGEDHPDGPGRLWRIRLNDGRIKRYCCEKAIVRRFP